MLKAAFEQLKLTLKDLSGIAVSIGPGMFSALRVGLGMAKGLALPHRLPLVGINTLDALARSAEPTRYLVVPVIDAYKSQVFAAIYTTGARRSDYLICTPEELSQLIDRDAILLGGGLERYQVIFKKLLGERFHTRTPNLPTPPAALIALMGLERIERGAVDDYLSLEPFYLRRTNAEIAKDRADAGIGPG
jgi:tRNA threonylcarbamoyl adenosine modification protein YeaZ